MLNFLTFATIVFTLVGVALYIDWRIANPKNKDVNLRRRRNHN